MKKLKMFFILFFITPYIVSSQESDTIHQKKYKISSCYILPGMQFQAKAAGTFSDFHKLIPQSVFFNSNLDTYTEQREINRATFYYSQSIGITKLNATKNTYRNNPELRVGFVYFTKSTLTNYYSTTEKGGVDTVSYNNVLYKYDSTTYKGVYLELKNEQIRFDVSTIWRTNPSTHYSLYGGIGLDIGTSLNSYASITQTEDTAIKITASTFPYPQISSKNAIYITDKVKLKNAFGASVYLPLGFDCQLGGTKVHVIGELRPYLNLNSIPELNKTVTTAGMKSSLGLCVNF